MPIELIIGIVAAITSLVSIFVGKLTEKYLSRSKEQTEQEESISGGLRKDLERKELEIATIKEELKIIEAQQDALKEKWWILYDRFSTLRVRVKSVLLENGWQMEDINRILPDLPDTLDR